MIEVELKAWIDDPAAVERRVAQFATFVRRYEKADEYWHGADWRLNRGQKGFRIRADDGTAVVTFKNKRVDSGIEINDERDFTVSSPENFALFAERVGCERFYEKRKIGVAYEADGVGIEISEVVGLGHFIEIERLVPNDNPAAVATAQGLVRTTLSRAGVPASDIESRSYSDMILTKVIRPR